MIEDFAGTEFCLVFPPKCDRSRESIAAQRGASCVPARRTGKRNREPVRLEIRGSRRRALGLFRSP
jgi:hypothetical protein